MEGDTVVSTPREVKAFYALKEVCGLNANTLGRFKDRFQFPERVKVRLPSEEDRACHFFPGEVCFYESTFICGLRFPVHPFLIKFLDRFGIAPGQLMPNLWRIVVGYMGIWLATNDGDMLKVDELIYLYRLKASKEHGYYELVPWEWKTRIVRVYLCLLGIGSPGFSLCLGTVLRLPLARFGVISPRLHHRWGNPDLRCIIISFSSFKFCCVYHSCY